MRGLSCLLSAAASLTTIGPAHAAIYCVTNGDGLQSALTAAAGSIENDEVRLVRGVYAAAQTFTYSSQNPGWVLVLGGYDSGCGSRGLNALSTVLDASGLHQVLSLAFPVEGPATAAPRIGVENLTLQNGFISGGILGGGAGVSILSYATGTAQAELWLDNVVVRNNSGFSGGGAFLFAAHGMIRVVNSLFEGNSAPTSELGHLNAISGGTEAVNGQGVIVANSTFVNGTCGNIGRSCGIGLLAPTGVRVDVLNSVFSNNLVSDVNIERGPTTGGTAYIDSSRVGTISGDVTPTITNAITAVPGFVDAAGGNFRLRDDSALIDRGLGVPAYYSFNSFDLDGNPRVRSGALDVGAYENQNMVFGNGFE